jgi:hypothetical protein
MLTLALKGFDSARDRTRAAIDALARPEDVFVPLSEALWWTVTVDDGFGDLAQHKHGYYLDRADYKKARNGDPSGQVLQALTYARNRCGHQRALVVAGSPAGVSGPVSRPLTAMLCWRPSGALPPPDPKHKNEALRKEYDRLLAGRPARAAVESASRWFAQERSRAGL